ncbi:MAG: hypothetical protein NC344_00405 [Bacteroidales bacterium]|nr:hypothetical protein [Bacteroidales bacterium]MCM1146297.1 hypothetical protein [Bacteroidales bacterium]MCM1205265.1 hypothetical protein [Bacillota bacterium]MCM1509650.1 hypothetical protein [Clostridium sp.]
MKKVLLLAAAVLTLGTATAHLGLDGTLGKSAQTTFRKVFDVKKADLDKEAKAGRIVLAGSVLDQKRAQSVKSAEPAFTGEAAPMIQAAAMENFQLAPAKAEILKKIAAKAPAAMSEKYTAKAGVYNSSDSKWYWSSNYTMEAGSFGEGYDYMLDIIPDNISGYGVPVFYTSKDNGDGTTAITIAPQWEARSTSHDIFICDYTDIRNGGDGSIKMTLAADGNLTFDNPVNIVGYYATPVNDNVDVSTGQEPPFVPADILGAYEQCQQVTFTLPVPDTFVAEATYTGKAYDAGEKTNVTWEMQIGTDNGTAVIRNLVPSISEDTGSELDVTYTLNGDKIVIHPQKVGEIALSSGTYYLYIFDWDSTDGSITLTKDAQNHIITPEDQIIVIGAFATDAYTTDYSSDDYAGYWTRHEKVTYYAEDQEIPNPAPTVMYEPAYTALNIGMSTNGYTYNADFGFLPGYAEIPYLNTTSDEVTSWSWEVCDSTYDATDKIYTPGTPVTGTTKNFSFMTEGFNTFGVPVLTGYNEDKASAPYNWGGEDRYYLSVGGGISSDEKDSQGGMFTVGACNPAFQFVYYSSLATPTLNRNNLNIKNIYMYQGTPAAPLYITGLNMMVREFSAQPGFSLTARIIEARRSTTGSITWGKTIAYADASLDDVVIGQNSVAQINFNDMYVLDEDEMSQGIDHLFLDKEFAVVIEDWNNGTFSCHPYGEYNYNDNGSYSTFFEQEEEPGNYYRYTDLWAHMALNFNDGTYGFLHTTGATDFTALAAGSEETIHIDDAMLRSVKADGSGYAPRVFLSDDCPEWITVSTDNADANGVNFDIKLNIAENDGEAREAKFYVFQEGAKIDVTVKQTGANGTGIAGVTVDETSASAPRYNVAGQRVANGTKGIVISNGKKQIAK